jgi:hypothetical protein
VAGGWFVLREKYCWLVVGGWSFLREKYCWLISQTNRVTVGACSECLHQADYINCYEDVANTDNADPVEELWNGKLCDD